MRLTVKASSNKLREATRTSSGTISVNGRDHFVGGEILEGKRARNVKSSYVLDSDSEDEEEDEDEEMDDVVEDDAEGDEDDEEMEEDDGLGDEDADADVDMDIAPPPSTIKVSKSQPKKQTIAAKQPAKAHTMSVEQKEVEMASDDEELSELDSDVGEEIEEEEAMQTGNEEDAEGEEEELEVEAEDDEDDLDSDDETPGGGSRASTPDLNKLTKRQRARFEEGGSGHLLALPDGKLRLTRDTHSANTLQRFKSRSI